MKTLSKNTKEILTFLAVLILVNCLFNAVLFVMAQSFNIGIGYLFSFVISCLVTATIMPDSE